MSRDVAKIFSAIDSLDPAQFVAHLTEDVTFRFGNPEAIHGREAVAAAVGGFYSTIGGMKHHILNVWEVDDTVIVKIDVEYTRQDGKTVITPNADILVFEGDLVRDWQIYIDVAPVYA
jgi:ketosteroid isomerase-like protein